MANGTQIPPRSQAATLTIGLGLIVGKAYPRKKKRGYSQMLQLLHVIHKSIVAQGAYQNGKRNDR